MPPAQLAPRIQGVEERLLETHRLPACVQAGTAFQIVADEWDLKGGAKA